MPPTTWAPHVYNSIPMLERFALKTNCILLTRSGCQVREENTCKRKSAATPVEREQEQDLTSSGRASPGGMLERVAVGEVGLLAALLGPAGR